MNTNNCNFFELNTMCLIFENDYRKSLVRLYNQRKIRSL